MDRSFPLPSRSYLPSSPSQSSPSHPSSTHHFASSYPTSPPPLPAGASPSFSPHASALADYGMDTPTRSHGGYGSLGLGMSSSPGGSGGKKRAPAPRPLDLESSNIRNDEGRWEEDEMGGKRRRNVTAPVLMTTVTKASPPVARQPSPPRNGMPSSVPLSAMPVQHHGSTSSVGSGRSSESSVNLPPIPRSLSQRLGWAVEGEEGRRASGVGSVEEDTRVSFDSYYYTRASPDPSPTSPVPNNLASSSHLLQTPQSKPPPSHFRSPSTPGPTDPKSLDRRGLIGVGELSTPRWVSPASASASGFGSYGWSGQSRRTQSISQSMSWDSLAGESPPLPLLPKTVAGPRARVPSQPGPGKVGLGVNVGGDDLMGGKSTGTIAPELPKLPSVGNFSPFSTKSTGTSAKEQSPGPSPSSSSPRSRKDSGGPSRRYSPRIAADVQAMRAREGRVASGGKMLDYSLPNSAGPGSAEVVAPASGSASGSGSGKTSRPSSAVKKTPPNSARRESKSSGGSMRGLSGGASPTVFGGADGAPTAQSIIKHFGSTRDFSHLPPSPSTASISKFMLRESASLASFSPLMGAGEGEGTPGSVSSATFSEFGAGGSGKKKEERTTYSTLDKETAEAIRKLDGLGKAGMRSRLTPGSEEEGPLRRPIARRAASSSSLGKEDKRDRDQQAYRDMPPPPVPARDGEVYRSRMVASGSGQVDWATEAAVDNATKVGTQKRASSSSTSAGTFASGHSAASTAPSSAHAYTSTFHNGRLSAGPEKSPSRRGSAGSGSPIMPGEISFPAEIELSENVPPVPPLPKGFHTIKQNHMPRSASFAAHDPPRAAAYVPMKDGSSPRLALQPTDDSPLLGTSFSSPVLGSDSATSPALPGSSSGFFNQASASGEKPRRMSKKWSFSSALNLISKDKSSDHLDVSSNASPRVDSASSAGEDAFSPSLSTWSGFDRQDAATPSLHTARNQNGTGQGRESSSSNSTTVPIIRESISGVTDFGPLSSAGSSSSRRMGPSIPFFRRTSAASVNSVPQPVIKEPSKTPTGSLASRKSVLGIGVPALLKGSHSRRNLAVQATEAPLDVSPPNDPPATERKSSLGWTGRRRGKTMSTSVMEALEKPAKALPPMQIKALPASMGDRLASPKKRPSASNVGLQQSVSSFLIGSQPTEGGPGMVRSNTNLSNTTDGTATPVTPAKTSTLPVARSTTSTTPMNGSSGLHSTPSATPTRIPRIISRAVASPAGNPASQMGPPSQPYAYSTSARASLPIASATMEREKTVTSMERHSVKTSVSEFGELADRAKNTPAARQSSNRDGTLDLPRTEDSPTTADTTINGHATRKAPVASTNSIRRALPTPPTPKAVTATTPSATRRSSKEVAEIPLRRTSLIVTAIGNENAQLTSTLPAPSVKPSIARPTQASAARAQATSPPSQYMAVPRPSSIRQSISSRSGSPANLLADDQQVGDDEMAMFLQKQHGKKKSSSAKPEDIDHLLNFPEPAEPLPELTPHSFIRANFENLSLYERREILDYSSIWYSGPKACKNAATPSVTQNNFGYDDDRGDYLIIPGDHLAYRYEIEGVLGKGSFGQVLQCRDHKTGECVAVKIIRNKKRFHNQALVEVKILENLVKWDPEDKHNLIKITQNFYFRGHLCIVTELLSINLYELIKANNFVGFSTILIRRFTHQLLASLSIMKQNRIIHCDLKPENILLRHPAKSALKVIDFGSSCFDHEKVYTYIQSRFYRSPEIILGCTYHMAIDMWSLGCILAEMFTGFPIFPGENEQEQLSCIMEVLGVPDRQFIERSSRKKLFFDSNGTPRPVVNSKGKRRRPGTKTLAQVLKSDDEQFVDFIAKCLTWDPERRMKPATAQRHPWIVAARRGRMTSPTPPVASSRQSAGPSNTTSPSVTRTRTLHQDILKDRISGPSPLIARKSTLQGSSAFSSTGGISSLAGTAAKPRMNQYSSTRNMSTARAA